MEKPSDNQKVLWWQPALILFTKMSGWILGPVLIAIFLGSWLDKRYQTGYLYFICIGIAFLLSIIGIVIEAKKSIKIINSLGKKEDHHGSRDNTNNKP